MIASFVDDASAPPEARAAMARPDALWIGRYLALEELGRGGMGVVHHGWDPELGRHVAIKMILDPTSMGENGRERLAREARAAARLRHAHIVTVHEVGEHPMTTAPGAPPRLCPFLVMDYVAGETLAEAHGRRAVPPRRLAEHIRDVARAIAHAHAHGVVHRDVKPQNVLIDREERRALLTDFGLARTGDAGDAAQQLTASGALVGTPQYLSPEQARGERRAIGPLSDVWGLGALLYWGLARRPPFDGDNVIEIVGRVCHTDPVPPRTIDPKVHPDLETIALRCLEKEPGRRYGSADEVAAELDRYIAGEAILARPVGRAGQLGRWARRNPAALIASVLAALLLVAAPAAGVGHLILSASARDRATAEARATILDEARRDAEAAWATFSDQRPDEAETGWTSDPAQADRILAAALAAFTAAHRLEGVAPDDREVRATTFRAAMALGETALALEQWSVAAGAFEKAAALGIDDPAAARAVAGVATLREARVRDEREAVAAILDEARTGRLGERPGGIEDAVFELVRHRSPETVATLVGELDRLTERLIATRGKLFREAAEPDADELRAGQGRIPGVEPALERWERLWEGEEAAKSVMAMLLPASARLVARARRHRDLGTNETVDAGSLVAGAQEEAVGADGLLTARLCCRALGRLGDASAIPALARHAYAHFDQLRAADAGIALCQIGSDEAVAIVQRARRWFSPNGPFSDRVERWLRRSRTIETPEPHADDGGASVAALIARCSDLLASADFDGAIAAATAILERDAERPAAWGNRASARYQKGDDAGAIADAKEMIRRWPRDARGYFLRGPARGRAGDLAGGVDDLTRAAELDPKLGAAWTNRGILLGAQGRWPEARDDFAHAVQLDGGVPGRWAHLGRSRLELGDLPGAVRDLDHALGLDPDLAMAWLHRGRARVRQGDQAGGIEDLNRAVELAPRDAEVARFRGVIRLEAGELAGALSDLTRSLELGEPNAPTLRARAKCRRLRGELRDALSDLDRAIELAPDDFHGRLERGNLRRKVGDLDGALIDLTRAVEVRPEHAAGWNDRAGLHKDRGELTASLQDYDRALELAPTLAQVWDNRGVVKRLAGDAPGAVADATRAIELDPTMVEYFSNRGLARTATEEFIGAREDFDRAIALDPSFASAWVDRGSLRRRVGDTEGALADFTRSIELHLANGAGWYNRATLRADLGDVAGAIEDMERFLQVAPKHAAAGRARKHLERWRGQN